MVGGWKFEVRGSRLEVGGSRFEVRGWRFEVGGWRFEVRGWRFEVRGWRFRAKGSVSQFRRNFLFQFFYCLPSLKRPFCLKNIQLPTSNLQQKRAAFRRKQPVAIPILFLETLLLLQFILLLKTFIQLLLLVIQVYFTALDKGIGYIAGGHVEDIT